jgi:predicted nucleic-acid-binding Zn-ribbon protein
MPLTDTQLNNLRRHLENQHPEGFKCSYCGASEGWNSDLVGLPTVNAENRLDLGDSYKLVAVMCANCQHTELFSNKVLR